MRKQLSVGRNNRLVASAFQIFCSISQMVASGWAVSNSTAANAEDITLPLLRETVPSTFRFTSFGLYRRDNEHDKYNREDQEKRDQDQQDFHSIRPFGDI